MDFSRPESWSGQPCPSPGDLPNPGIKPRFPALQADSLPAEPPGKPKNTGVGSLSLLQRISPAQELNRGLLHCRWILYSGGDDIPTSQGWMRIEALSCKALSTLLAHSVKRQPPSHPHWTLFCAPQGAGGNSQVALCVRTQRALTLRQQVVERRRKFLKPTYIRCFSHH